MSRTFSIFMLFVFMTGFSGAPGAQDYIVVGWNDLGMHCSNHYFNTLAVLPPYNNIYAHVIRVGDATRNPQVVTENIRVTYEIPGNTYSVGKTDFWDYEDQLFGVNLEPNIGLTGAGLSGQMEVSGNAFIIEGVPLTPFTDSDLTNEDPYQQAHLRAYLNDQLVAETHPVIPVSNEMNCVSSGCHSSETNILSEHEREDGFNPSDTPILCAYCHASPALGTTGRGEAPPLSQVVHLEHAERTSNCYLCHPGPNTQCLRGVMKTRFDMECQDCHGSMTNVGQSIRQGRTPWLQEPSCGVASCHGGAYAEQPGTLFRLSTGHGGLYCSTCHGSPHAILPSGNARDNAQNIALQGFAGILSDCTVCHGIVPAGPGPHGMTPVFVQVDALPLHFTLNPNYPNPFNPVTTISFHIAEGGIVSLTVFSESGQVAEKLIDSQYLHPGEHYRVFEAGDLAAGVYHVMLDVSGRLQSRKMTLLK